MNRQTEAGTKIRHGAAAASRRTSKPASGVNGATHETTQKAGHGDTEIKLLSVNWMNPDGGHAHREKLIAEAAYHRAEIRGFEPGHELDDWLQAESEVDARLVGEGKAY